MPVSVLGITDEVTRCDCCGRSDLKLTVILHRDGETVHFGRDCAAAALAARRRRGGGAIVEQLARAADFARRRTADLPPEEIRRRLLVAGWANFDGRTVWNDAGRVDISDVQPSATRSS